MGIILDHVGTVFDGALLHAEPVRHEGIPHFSVQDPRQSGSRKPSDVRACLSPSSGTLTRSICTLLLDVIKPVRVLQE